MASRSGEADGAVLAGIYSGGAWLAERLAKDLDVKEFGVVNVSLHRDDYAKKGLHSQASPTSLPFEVDNRRIVLIDDVLSTGRTMRAAVNELYDYGRPASVALAVLADRGGRELPMAARFAGGVVEVAADQRPRARQAGRRHVHLHDRSARRLKAARLHHHRTQSPGSK